MGENNLLPLFHELRRITRIKDNGRQTPDIRRQPKRERKNNELHEGKGDNFSLFLFFNVSS